jgi:hypothetical protein
VAIAGWTSIKDERSSSSPRFGSGTSPVHFACGEAAELVRVRIVATRVSRLRTVCIFSGVFHQTTGMSFASVPKIVLVSD